MTIARAPKQRGSRGDCREGERESHVHDDHGANFQSAVRISSVARPKDAAITGKEPAIDSEAEASWQRDSPRQAANQLFRPRYDA
jgi:hypothetical protein